MSEIQRSDEPIRIETSQVELILVQMHNTDDDKAYFELQNLNLDFWKEFGNSIYESVEEVTEQRLEHGNGRYGIWLEDKLVGVASYSTKGHEREAEMGILLDKDAEGHGYAILAVKALTEFAKLRFDRVYAEVSPDNDKSISLLNRLGYIAKGEPVEREWGMALVFEVAK